MLRQIIALVTLAAFLLFSCACVSHMVKKVPWPEVVAKNPEKAKIVGAERKSGQITQFSAKKPARIQGEFLIYERRAKNFEIQAAQVKEIQELPAGWKKPKYEITSEDGKSFRAFSYKKKERKLICDLEIRESISLADVNLVLVRKVNVPLTVLLNILWMAPVAGIVALAIAQPIFGPIISFGW